MTRVPIAGVLQDLGNPEVEQFWHTRGGYENVLRLDVAMDDQVLMRIAHGIAYEKEEIQALADRETLLVGVLIDGLAIDIFH